MTSLTRLAWLTGARFAIAIAVFGVAALLQLLAFHRDDRPSLLEVLLGTAVAAFAVWLLRRQLDAFADRRSFGAKAAGYREVRQLLSRMGSTLPIDDVVPQLAETLARRAHSVRTEVRLQLENGDEWREVWPPHGRSSPNQLTVQVVHAGMDVGEIDVQTDGAATRSDRDLLDSIVGPAGLALSTVRLTFGLRRRAVELAELNRELAESKRRLVEARVDERRQFTAELDERVLPHLARADDIVEQARMSSYRHAVTAHLQPAAAELTVALDALRAIARRTYPPRLDDAGLVTALESWRDGVLQVETIGDLSKSEIPASVEACVYFAVVAWCAEAEELGPVVLAAEDGAIAFTLQGRLSDGERMLRPMRDRVEAFGGTLQTSGDTRTVVVGRIPLAGPDPPLEVP